MDQVRPAQGHGALSGQIQGKVASVALDLAICGFCTMAAYLIRFEGTVPDRFFRQMLILVPALAATRVLTNAGMGVYRVVWSYFGLRETMRFVKSVAVASAVLLVSRIFLLGESPYFLIPFSIIIIESVFTFIGMTGTRFLPRILAERDSERRVHTALPTLLVGAGQNGHTVARELLRNPALGMRPIGFLDDDMAKSGRDIYGLRVLGTVTDAERVLGRTGARQLVITTPRIGPTKILRLVATCRQLGVRVRIVPRLFEFREQRPGAPSLRDVRIEDLLSRNPVEPSLSLVDLTKEYGGRRILVTGAGGSIGSELCRQLVLMKPATLILVERDENNLFHIELELGQQGFGRFLRPVLVDINHAKELEQTFRDTRPQVVFHAAAYKHVPMMERFPWKAVQNNVFATQQIAELSIAHGVETFVMISTDKAVRPTSVMGATKRFAELTIQNLAAQNTTRFSCVRFGNVLGSRGSVVGIFQDQIEQGGPITVTHPEVRRYFMTIPEAANLVIQAATIGHRGEVFLLDMGEPVKIVDLARQMLVLSGLTEEDVAIEFIGMRPGEKLFEELRNEEEGLSQTALRKVFLCQPIALDPDRTKRILERLRFVVRAKDGNGVRDCLLDLDIGYRPEKVAQQQG